MINFHILRNLPLSLGSFMGVIFGIALFGTSFILPQFTQQLRGYPAFQAGLILAPRAAMLMLCMPVVGRLYRHLDARVLVIFGILVTAWSYDDLARLSLKAGFWNRVPTLLKVLVKGNVIVLGRRADVAEKRLLDLFDKFGYCCGKSTISVFTQKQHFPT